VGVGLDLLEIDRMERALARRPRLAQRLFTAAELEYAARKARPAQHLAARFCAKEAVAKALGVEVWSPLEVEVVPTATGPQIRLSGRLAELGVDVQVSLTHSRGMAGAVAVAK
jgi:holo-[acyl-carrier protein] synthase